jgi:hypothetical protein
MDAHILDAIAATPAYKFLRSVSTDSIAMEYLSGCTHVRCDGSCALSMAISLGKLRPSQVMRDFNLWRAMVRL